MSLGDLVATDAAWVTELLDDDLQSRPLVEVYDTLLIPALALAENDKKDEAMKQLGALAADGTSGYRLLAKLEKAEILAGLERVVWPLFAVGTLRPVIYRTLPLTAAELMRIATQS